MINSFSNQYLQSTRKYNEVNSPIHNSSKTISSLTGNVQDLNEDNSKAVLKGKIKTERHVMFPGRMTQYCKDANYCKTILNI